MARRRTRPGPRTEARQDLIKQLLGEREETGESYRSLEERSGIPAATLASWQRKLRAEASARASEEIELLEVQSPTWLTTRNPIEIELAAGVTIRVSNGFDADAVGAILDLVMERC